MLLFLHIGILLPDHKHVSTELVWETLLYCTHKYCGYHNRICCCSSQGTIPLDKWLQFVSCRHKQLLSSLPLLHSWSPPCYSRPALVSHWYLLSHRSLRELMETSCEFLDKMNFLIEVQFAVWLAGAIPTAVYRYREDHADHTEKIS